MLPGTWQARDDKIFIRNPDGKVEILSTNWEEMRNLAKAEDSAEVRESKEAIKQNQAIKREAASKKRGGRGC